MPGKVHASANVWLANIVPLADPQVTPVILALHHLMAEVSETILAAFKFRYSKGLVCTAVTHTEIAAVGVLNTCLSEARAVVLGRGTASFVHRQSSAICFFLES